VNIDAWDGDTVKIYSESYHSVHVEQPEEDGDFSRVIGIDQQEKSGARYKEGTEVLKKLLVGKLALALFSQEDGVDEYDIPDNALRAHDGRKPRRRAYFFIIDSNNPNILLNVTHLIAEKGCGKLDLLVRNPLPEKLRLTMVENKTRALVGTVL